MEPSRDVAFLAPLLLNQDRVNKILVALSLLLLVSIPKARAFPDFMDFFTKVRAEPLAIEDQGPRKTAVVYQAKKPIPGPKPMIVLLHGFSGDADRTNEYFGLSRLAAERNFVLLSPEGTRNSAGFAFWNATDFCCDNEKSGIDDTSYLLKLILTARERYDVDPSRIYLVGHSNGGLMSSRLACEAPSLFAAVVSLAGGTFETDSDCKIPAPLSHLQIHAVDDPTILFERAEKYAGGRESVERRILINGCSGPAESGGALDLVKPIPGSDTDVSLWKNCHQGTEVALWLIKPYVGRPGAPHKPAFQSDFAHRILDWLLAQKKSQNE